MARDGRRPGRWDNDRRTPRRFVDGDRVRGSVSGDTHEMAFDRGEQIEGGGRIIIRRLGQCVDEDHADHMDMRTIPIRCVILGRQWCLSPARLSAGADQPIAYP